MKRRGNEPIMIVGIFVLLIVTILVMFGVYKGLRDSFEPIEKESYCISQVIAHAEAVRFTNGKANPRITCPTLRVEKTVGGQEEARKMIAQEMKRCWSIWGKGQYELFGNKEGFYCHMCSMITLSGVDEVQGMNKYLSENYATKDQSYEEYFTAQHLGGAAQDQKTKQLSDIEGAPIPTTKPIAVIFYYAKGFTWQQRMWNAIIDHTTITPIVGGVAGGYLVGKVAAAGVGLVLGASNPVGWGVVASAVIAGTATGATAGMTAAVYGSAKTNYTALIVVRPLDPDKIEGLGCQIDPVSN